MSIEQNIADSVKVLAQLMLKQQAWLATAESCTGGMIAQAVTDLSGSSAWFDRGFVTYSNVAKQQLLGVNESTLTQAGAVSQACVIEMVKGALRHSNADYVVACSGIAGPSGGSSDKPVGTVWLAWGRRQDGSSAQVIAKVFHFEGNRQAVRQKTTLAGLQGLLGLVNDEIINK
jgi:nicotinamide-nucleotide amidase